MADDIIDLSSYRARAQEAESAPEGEERSFFSVWGGEGERSRFALPLWRAIYLAAGRRAGLVWIEPDSPDEPRSFFVLDLGSEPARVEFDALDLPDGDLEAPLLFESGDALVVFLGLEEERPWFMVLGERDGTTHPEGKTREDLMFLAGECAGLLFKVGLADEAPE